MTSNLAPIPCPLCCQEEEFLPVKVPKRDGHIAGYGEIYAGRTKSEWKDCDRFGFVHQNPRPTKEALNRYYLEGNYRREHVFPKVDSYKAFADWYYGEKVAYTSAKTGLRYGAVFDIGCGYGPALHVFRSHGWLCFGIEADPQCCEFARNQLDLNGVFCGVLTREAKPVGTIDVVFSNHTFEHIADLEEVMLGIRRLLKPGGWVVTIVPTYYRNRSSMSKRWMNSGHYSLFTHRSLSHLFSQYGFVDVDFTYRGWKTETEIDELWHVARYADSATDTTRYFEDPLRVRRYLEITNPIRSLVYFPVYAYHPQRRQFRQKLVNALKLLWRSPGQFGSKLAKRLLPGNAADC